MGQGECLSDSPSPQVKSSVPAKILPANGP
jgi:hypothetical protein